MARGIRRQRILTTALLLATTTVMIACNRPTPITPASYQTIPLAVDPSAELLYLEILPANEHGASIWVLKGGPELGQKILTDGALTFVDSLPSSPGPHPPNTIIARQMKVYENFVKMLGRYSVDVREGWQTGSQHSSGNIEQGMGTVRYTVLQTKEHTYLELTRW